MNFLNDTELKVFLGIASEKMGIDKFKSRYFHFRKQLYEQFIELAHFPKHEQSSNNIVLINLQNGTFEITPEGTHLRPFNRSDFLTYQLPFKYDPSATAPIFEAYLDKVLPNRELQDVLEVVRSLLGDQNTSEYSLQSLTDNSGYYRAMLANKLVNYASELSGKLQTSLFKQLSSGEPIEARHPYGRPFIVRDYAKLIFNCNELPTDIKQTEAYFRRFLIINFEITIPDNEQDKQLAQRIIKNELSGVFNKVLQGLGRLLDQKDFTECDAIKFALEQYKIESDSVKLFLQEMAYNSNPTNYIQVDLLFSEYRKFCIDRGYSPVNQRNFRKRLISSKILIERKNMGQVAYLSKT